ncbi:SLAP domain-containing protein [Sutcliffiella deserti]|uniref:SLAP domain-containing protein n=1 Tax=Sutcliffiella deserti TaxID=2875501 RepID=UPI001CBDA1D0|nr:SLAP domain-containing protein [Sutcliffiella deserti]
MKKILVPFAVLMIGSTLVACSGNEYASTRKVDKVDETEVAGSEVEKETSEPAIDGATAQAAAEEVLQSHFKLLDEGDSEGYWKLFETPGDEDSVATVQKIMELKSSSELRDIKVIYQKDKEVLATFDMSQITEEFDPYNNFNRRGEGFIVLKMMEDGGWKISHLDYITLLHLDFYGERDKESFSYMDEDNLFFWSKELAKLKREKQLPSEWAGAFLAELQRIDDAIPDQPLHFTQKMIDGLAPEALATLQKVLNELGDPPKDTITIHNFFFYEEHLESDYIVFNAFIRNGFDYPVSNLHGPVSLTAEAWDENDELVDVEVARMTMEFDGLGTIEPGATGLATIYFGPESIMVSNLEEFLAYGEFEIEAELTHSGD